MNLLRLLLWGPLSFVIRRLSYESALNVGKLIGRISCALMGRRRRVLTEEFSRMFPEKSPTEIAAIVRETFELRSATEIENTLHHRFSPANIDTMIRVEGLDRLKESLAKGKGVVLATFHFGAHLQIMPALGHRGYKVNQVALAWELGEDNKEKPGAVTGMVAKKLKDMRWKLSAEKLPANVIPLGPGSSARPLFRKLRDNEIVVIAVDGRGVGNTQLEALPFFYNDRYWFAPGPVDLGLRTGAPVHPIFIVRDDRGINTLVIEPALTLVGGADDLVSGTAQCVARLTEHVKRHPGHYGMEILFERRRLEREAMFPMGPPPGAR